MDNYGVCFAYDLNMSPGAIPLLSIVNFQLSMKKPPLRRRKDDITTWYHLDLQTLDCHAPAGLAMTTGVCLKAL